MHAGQLIDTGQLYEGSLLTGADGGGGGPGGPDPPPPPPFDQGLPLQIFSAVYFLNRFASFYKVLTLDPLSIFFWVCPWLYTQLKATGLWLFVGHLIALLIHDNKIIMSIHRKCLIVQVEFHTARQPARREVQYYVENFVFVRHGWGLNRPGLPPGASYLHWNNIPLNSYHTHPGQIK